MSVRLSYRVIEACYDVHRQMGPGLLESAYHFGLIKALKKRGIRFKSELALYAYYDGEPVKGYYADFLIQNELVLEIKAVKSLDDTMSAQVINYVKLSGAPAGLLINFSGKSVVVKRFNNRG